MINIDENTIKEILQKEVKGQVQKQVEKYCNSKDFKNMVRDEIRGQLLHHINFSHISNLTQNIMKDNNYTDIIAQSISDRIFDNLKYAINQENDDY
ncbi:hypothetical protein [Clostridium sp.]|uniref:hypothetical protein n=1 Tax=Clostridium sp. TaxID=1506 RepID=UPI002914E820|nr:hypothetical protein [Clostridium sp.]MDU3410017.1 hypothetical protein [Clostridium sp.]